MILISDGQLDHSQARSQSHYPSFPLNGSHPEEEGTVSIMEYGIILIDYRRK